MTTNILLFTSRHCPHCSSIINTFEQLQHEGATLKLDVINVEDNPERAAELGIRSVPWFRIGVLDFHGAYSPKELAYWVEHANTTQGIREYIIKELEVGRLTSIKNMLLNSV